MSSDTQPTVVKTTATGRAATRPTVDQVDVRGPRFAAWITTAVLALVLAIQAVVFAVGAVSGPRRSPYGALFANFVAPRLGPTTEREPTAPLKFAQLVGFAFAAVGVLAFALGAPVVAAVATGFALFAAFLNAAFAFCLGCQIYPLVARLRTQSARA